MISQNSFSNLPGQGLARPTGTQGLELLPREEADKEAQKRAENEGKIAQHMEDYGIYWNPVSTTSIAKPQKEQTTARKQT